MVKTGARLPETRPLEPAQPWPTAPERPLTADRSASERSQLSRVTFLARRRPGGRCGVTGAPRVTRWTFTPSVTSLEGQGF